ncbi:hypothetical protein CYLTODRAFT_490008 [Cylindrobasidium torrendii FP15055 ss-10]|uniref:Protein kinase domain-containing protein n=1 Tax=Cylindrobasidium torrendii FP15055 ss-10 TaxID=1314674 RepID=A0A0D7BCI0_9AGAR|nr:hypothetical protein CYLTODRAFT_490008 [Cylindrobasidium torrendii FP15055 ss-10]
MTSKLVVATSSLGALVVIAAAFRPPRIVKIGGFWCSVYWSFRSWAWNYPISSDESVWEPYNDPDCNPRTLVKFFEHRNRIWDFMRPFFASRGYDLYVARCSAELEQYPSPTSVEPQKAPSYPYARQFCNLNEDFMFHTIKPRAWAARDRRGYEVVIKAISNEDATPELRALRFLQSNEILDDPRARIIPILDWIDAFGHTFIVMPRWGDLERADFVTVGELVRYFHDLAETVAFLHSKGISHSDIGMNVVMDAQTGGQFSAPKLAGLRGPECRYALIDFGCATFYSEDDGKVLGWRGSLEASFKADVSWLSWLTISRVMCIGSDLLPDLEALLRAMEDVDSPTQPTSADVLQRFDAMCATLTTSDMEKPLSAVFWNEHDGTYRMRTKDIVYAPPYPPTS